MQNCWVNKLRAFKRTLQRGKGGRGQFDTTQIWLEVMRLQYRSIWRVNGVFFWGGEGHTEDWSWRWHVVACGGCRRLVKGSQEHRRCEGGCWRREPLRYNLHKYFGTVRRTRKLHHKLLDFRISNNLATVSVASLCARKFLGLSWFCSGITCSSFSMRYRAPVLFQICLLKKVVEEEGKRQLIKKIDQWI